MGRPSLHWPINLLPVTYKIFECLLLNHISPTIKQSKSIANRQFEFHKNHSTTQQLHYVIDFSSTRLKNKNYTAGVFLSVTSAIDRVWHECLLSKMKNVLNDTYYRIMLSLLNDRFFIERQSAARLILKKYCSRSSQGSVLSPFLYCYSPQNNNTRTATNADDTVIMTSEKTPEEVSLLNIQHLLNYLETWLKKYGK